MAGPSLTFGNLLICSKNNSNKITKGIDKFKFVEIVKIRK